MHSIPVLDALRDRYVLERELGRGGMATVYLARDLKHGRMVALKVMRPEIAQAIGPERFLHEIRITSRLDHPHILTLIDSGESDGYLWYVLPYVRGESLRAKLEREKQLPVEETIRIATQVAAALDYAHRQGIIHRDIKPENILLHEGEAVVTDFGIALAVREAGGERLTGTGLSLGTPQYMSPEQATGDRELDARTDVYALAAVVYEMLAGEPPFTGPTVQSIIAKQLTDRPLGLGVTRQDLPPHIDAVVRRGLAKVPADRFAGTAEFATALTAPAAGRPGHSLEHRKRAAVGLAAATIIVAIAAILVMPEKEQGVASAPAGTDVASVAVLPFDNLTGNPGDDYLSDGMTEEVIAQLAQVPGLKVISRTSTEALKGSGFTLRQIADTLDVQHILEGSVRHADNRVRVTVDLIDARTDAHVWSSRYDRDLTDVFAVQEEIARNVADSLVSAVGVRIVGRARSHDPAAYAAYLEGRTQLYRRTREGLRSAVTLFQQAIAQDSTFAPAYASLASAYYLLVIYQYGGVDYLSAYTRALELANRAVALDSNLGEGFAIRGLTLARGWGPSARIAADFDRALELLPNSADVHQWRSNFLSREGRNEEAFAEAQRAVALDPLSPGARATSAFSALNVRRYDVAIAEAERVAGLEPSLARPRMLGAVADILSGNFARCLTRNLSAFRGLRAICLHALGRGPEAERTVDSVKAQIQAGIAADSSFVASRAIQGLAQYYAWLGDAEQSLAWLERAYAVTPEGEDFRMLATGLYDKVRNDPRFRAGLTRIRATIYGRLSTPTDVERR